MKKLFLTLLLLSTAVFYANAQEPCNCNEPAVWKNKIVDLCPLFYFQTVPPDPHPDFNPLGIPAPNLVWIEFKWEERTCNGITYINMLSTTLNTPLFNYLDDIPSVLVFMDDPFQPAGCCPFVAGGVGSPPLYGPGHPTNFYDYTGMSAYINFLTEMFGPKGNMALPSPLVEGGCKEMVVIRWPTGAGVYSPGGDNPSGGTAPPVFHPLTTSFEWVNCPGTTCCAWTQTDDGRHYITVPPNEAECSTKVRDPQYSPAVNTKDQFGNPVTYTGEIIHGFGCKASCPTYSPVATFTTGLSNQIVPIELTASPTLVDDKINFTSNLKITATTIFDMKGSKVNGSTLSNNTLNVENLQTGIYFIQVQFEDKQIRTIKIAKQ